MKILPECPVQHGSIRNIAYGLVDNAPARTTFNGIALRARYKTTRVDDIVAQYQRKLEERAARWRAANPGAVATWDRLTLCGMSIPARPRYGKEEIRKQLAEMARGFGFEVVMAAPARALPPGEKQKWYRLVRETGPEADRTRAMVGRAFGFDEPLNTVTGRTMPSTTDVLGLVLNMRDVRASGTAIAADVATSTRDTLAMIADGAAHIVANK